MTAEELLEAKKKRNAEYRAKKKDAITAQDRDAKMTEKQEREAEKERIKMEREAEKERIKLEREAVKEDKLKWKRHRELELLEKEEAKRLERVREKVLNGDLFDKIQVKRSIFDTLKIPTKWIKNSRGEYEKRPIEQPKLKPNFKIDNKDSGVKWIDAEDDDGNDCKVKTVMLNGERLLCYESDEGWINHYTDENGDTFKKVIINLNTDDEEIINYIKPHNTHNWIRGETE